MHRSALVIGKFYPPHSGHHALIRQAAQVAESVTVVVMASMQETILLHDRVEWIEAEHRDERVTVVGVPCDAPLDVNDDGVWAAQIAVMQAAVRSIDSRPVDVVLSGESYGAELARRLGAAHIRIDRSVNPVSGTAVRAHLASRWDELAPATRAGLATRVVVLGAESTGTTTLAGDLVEHYQSRGGVWRRTAVVGEYGRDYSAILRERQVVGINDLTWVAEDFDRIAQEQTHRETEAAQLGSPLLVCDTDAFTTSVWERRYLGDHARNGQSWSLPPELPRHDLYLLTDHTSVAWRDDGLREGDLAVREAMTVWFADALTAAGRSWFLVTGNREQRLSITARAVDAVLAHRMSFADPVSGPGFERCPS